jgi:hypothetical protein
MVFLSYLLLPLAKAAFFGPTAIASRGADDIFAETLFQNGNCAVTNKTAASDSDFW